MVYPTEANHCESKAELSMRFALWATALRRTPTCAEVEKRFGFSRATAYRYIRAWLAANG